MQYRASTYAEGVYDIYWFEKNILGDVTAVWYKVLTYIVAFVIPVAVDLAVQATNQLENTGTIDFAEFDWVRAVKNGALSLASAMVPGTTVAITGTYDVGVSIITWSIASVLLGAADIANTKLGAVISEWF